MRSMSVLARFLDLSGDDRWLLAEAGWRLVLAWAAVRFLPFRRALKTSCISLGHSRRFDAQRLVWAVQSAATRVPFRAVCFQQGLAFQAMVRARGGNAKLHYGVGKDRAGGLAAHVWVSLEDRILIGGEEAPRYEQLVVLP